MPLAAVICIGGFSLTTVISKVYNRQIKISREEVKTTHFTLFFGIVYVFVAASAITTTLESFSVSTLTDILVRNSVGTQQLQNIFLFLSYFATAIAFIHAGITFLATDALHDLTKGKAYLVLPHFSVIFSEVVILFFMAAQDDNIIGFTKLTIALMVIDIIWVGLYHRKRNLVFLEWAHYNVMTLVFLVIVLITPLSLMSFVLLFLITFLRSLCDYIIGWDNLYANYPFKGV